MQPSGRSSPPIAAPTMPCLDCESHELSEAIGVRSTPCEAFPGNAAGVCAAIVRRIDMQNTSRTQGRRLRSGFRECMRPGRDSGPSGNDVGHPQGDGVRSTPYRLITSRVRARCRLSRVRGRQPGHPSRCRRGRAGGRRRPRALSPRDATCQRPRSNGW